MGIDVAKLLITVGADVTGAQKGLNQVTDKMDDFAAKGQRLGGILTLGVTTPLVAMGTKAVMAASDLSESMNKVNVVFDETSGAVTGSSQTARTQLGISQQAALEATGTFGNLFITMGLGEDAAADMSMELVQLASDLGSFNNIDPGIVLEKLRAGLVGEVEPLRVLGVNVQESVVQLKAMEMGLAATAEELTNQDKVMARYAIIMEQTTTAQGDFARTSDGLANMMRTTKATVLDAAAAFGEVMLPYVLQGVDYVKDLIERLLGLDDAQKKSIVTWLAVAAAAGPALLVLSTMAKVMGGGIQVALALGGAMMTLGRNVQAVQAAYQAGLTASTAMQVGFGAQMAVLGPLAIALGVVVGAYVLYNATIGKTAKELEKLQQVKMDEYFKAQSVGIYTAEQALGSYLAVYQNYWKEVNSQGAQSKVAAFLAKDSDDMKDAAGKLGSVLAGLGGDYRDYAEAVLEARMMSGDLNRKIGEGILANYDLGASIDATIKNYGGLTKAEYEAAINTAKNAKMIAALGGEAAVAAMRINGATYNTQAWIDTGKSFGPAVGEMTEVSKELADAAENAAMALVQVGLSGQLAGGLTPYTETIADLRGEYQGLWTEMQQAIIAGWDPTSNKVTELTNKMHDNAGAQQDAAAAMREATTEMIFQQAAAGMDAQSTLTLARAMGVLSEQDYAVAQTIQNLKTQFAGMDGVMSPTEAVLYAQAVQDVNTAIQNLAMAGEPITIENINEQIAGLDADSAAAFDALAANANISAVAVNDAFAANTTTMTASAGTAADGIATAFTTGEDWSAVGTGIDDGIALGITKGIPAVEAAARAAAEAALQAAMETLDMRSPSKEFAWVGEQTMAGFAQGIRENMVMPVHAATVAASATTAGANLANQTYNTTTYSPNVNVNAAVASDIDVYELAQTIADTIRRERM